MEDQGNVDLLLKDELVFEVQLRGEVPATNVGDLRKQLRGLLKASKPADADVGNEPAVEWEWCQERAAELFNLIEDLGEQLDVNCRSTVRLRTRLGHLERRLRNLEKRGVVLAKEEWPITQLIIRVEEFLRLLSGVGKKEKTKTDGVVATPGQPDGEERPIAEVELKSVNERVSSPALQKISGRDDNLAENFSLVPLGIGTNYNRLPNPMGVILQKLPSTDGLDTDVLLNFLNNLIRLREFPGMSEVNLLHLAYPYCRGPLAERLRSCLENGGGFDKFHADVLDFFIPGRRWEQLRQEQFYRLQRRNESLAAFVEEIKQAGKVLRVGLPEAEVVGVIMEGVTPEERSRLVFANFPRSFSDLDRLCVRSRNVAYTDNLRTVRTGTSAGNSVPVRAVVPPGPQQVERRGIGPVCYECGRRGHIRRFCPQAQHGQRSSLAPEQNSGRFDSGHSKNV